MSFRIHCAAVFLALAASLTTMAQPAPTPAKVILDTDIGDDVDDVFALALALTSPEIKLVGITSAWGDTALRTRMINRLLCETGRDDIPVHTGIATKATSQFSQRAWANRGIQRPNEASADAVEFLLDQIRQNPGEITLIAIGPLTNVGAAIDRDAATFSKLKRVVLMGGSINRSYDDFGYAPPHTPSAEYNIAMDVRASQKLFHSGVPISMMPLDSTQVKFDEVKRSLLASISTPLTDALQVLTAEWARANSMTTPTLFDPVAVAYAIRPETCPTTPLRIEVDDKGFTRQVEGAPNAQVCLEQRTDAFFNLLMPRLLTQRLSGSKVCTVPEPHAP
ncbi:MAG TPA: nucleoside hydrolase [Edaphobacter sp.]